MTLEDAREILERVKDRRAQLAWSDDKSERAALASTFDQIAAKLFLVEAEEQAEEEEQAESDSPQPMNAEGILEALRAGLACLPEHPGDGVDYATLRAYDEELTTELEALRDLCRELVRTDTK
ncbi:MAG: hypothetical protein ACYS26_22850 [Planctomycetota bacterium]